MVQKGGEVIVTWPGGQGAPTPIPTSGGKRKTRKQRKSKKGTRKSKRTTRRR